MTKKKKKGHSVRNVEGHGYVKCMKFWQLCRPYLWQVENWSISFPRCWSWSRWWRRRRRRGRGVLKRCVHYYYFGSSGWLYFGFLDRDFITDVGADGEEMDRRATDHQRFDRRQRELSDADLARLAEDVEQRYRRSSAAVPYSGDMSTDSFFFTNSRAAISSIGTSAMPRLRKIPTRPWHAFCTAAWLRAST